MEWDVVIVGTGMGGAALGYALATNGYRVLFIEKGFAQFASGEVDDPDAVDPETRLRHGRWPDQISGSVDSYPVRFFPALGCGVGGSTLLYAATVERLSPTDFEAVDARGTPVWPIGYSRLEPFYAIAEQLLHARGSQDPLEPPSDVRPPPPLSSCDRHFFKSLTANGMHPYQVHAACRYVDGCNHCGGVICYKGCKQDARSAFVGPALASGHATLFDGCTVERVEADEKKVTGLVCRRNGETFSISAKIYVLAAGALSTPVLLLNSANDAWPDGIANSSGLVGRNLMFHVSDFFAVWPRGRTRVSDPGKSIGLRDFYEYGELRLGMIQSTGLTATTSNVLHFLLSVIDRSGWRWLRLFKPLLRIPALIGSLLFGKATIFASILEDVAYPENRVVPISRNSDGIYFEYTVHDELRQRVRLFRRLYRQAFKRHSMMVLGPEINLNYGHACGTCRFGHDPERTVLDANNRSHDLANLYIVDASFFPTSGGVNPSLTIAANALRVGAHVARELAALKSGCPDGCLPSTAS